MNVISLTRDELATILNDEPANWNVKTVTVDGPYVSDDGIEGRAIRTIALHIPTGVEVITYANLCSDGIDSWTEDEGYEPIVTNARQVHGAHYEDYELVHLIPMHLQAMGTTASTVLF